MVTRDKKQVIRTYPRRRQTLKPILQASRVPLLPPSSQVLSALQGILVENSADPR